MIVKAYETKRLQSCAVILTALSAGRREKSLIVKPGLIDWAWGLFVNLFDRLVRLDDGLAGAFKEEVLSFLLVFGAFVGLD